MAEFSLVKYLILNKILSNLNILDTSTVHSQVALYTFVFFIHKYS